MMQSSPLFCFLFIVMCVYTMYMVKKNWRWFFLALLLGLFYYQLWFSSILKQYGMPSAYVVNCKCNSSLAEFTRLALGAMQPLDPGLHRPVLWAGPIICVWWFNCCSALCHTQMDFCIENSFWVDQITSSLILFLIFVSFYVMQG